MNQNEYKKIISLAIQREVEAYTFYHNVSAKAKDKSIKIYFQKNLPRRSWNTGIL